MTAIGAPEKATQDRVIKLFTDQLGYTYLGDWKDRDDNSNVEEELLSNHLTSTGYNTVQIQKAIHALKTEALNPQRDLLDSNQVVYNLLRYGVAVKEEAGKPTETVHLIDWMTPENNDFSIAEEVTLKGKHERRPDLVIYLNGIAVAVIELKNGRVNVGEGISQLISNQKSEFNEWFFTTSQLLIAGNDSEGLRYGTTRTPSKYYLTWKEDVQSNALSKLDKYLIKMCSKERLIELMHDFILFDGGVKKVPRVHQYFGLKAAQESLNQRKGGIIWHTQGAGKSILMVLLAKWILENKPDGRVVIVTDRDELDKQIKGVFESAGETIHQSSSGRDLIDHLGQAKPRLLCSLVHKFGNKEQDDFDAYLKQLKSEPSKTVGDIYVFVDECHRTQSGRFNEAMQAVMPNAIFVGFTGTPLLKKDKATSIEVFGGYIHTYKFSEAVDDGVVLDLMYEARDIDQELSSRDKVDDWFDAKTKGLNDWQRDELKKKWGTMQIVLSSRSRMEKIVSDILFDFGTKPRLSNSRGNAILVASSIYEACKYYTLFQKTPFKGLCAVISSYNPNAGDISKEDIGVNTETQKEFIYNTYTELLENVVAKANKTKTETYEDDSKKLFIKKPNQMKLLVVVDKLLTGFDAPSCSYLYIDKKMQDHGLFQAICRTNRLDGEDKDYGYIVDYKDLFNKVEDAISVYSSELDHSEGKDSEILMKDRLKEGREKLDNALEAHALICEPVQPPKGQHEHIQYFCGNTEIASDLQECEPQRSALYKATARLIRSYACIADEMQKAGYSEAETQHIQNRLEKATKLRETIKLASGETLDLKAYEADMRHLIDTYINAADPEKISPFDDIGLLDLIVKSGIADAIDGKLGDLKENQGAVAETIENNVRSKIIKEHLNDPAFFDKMSALLDEIIAQRKAKAIEYAEYLKQIAEVVKKVTQGQSNNQPVALDTSGKLALFNNLVVQPVANGLKEDETPYITKNDEDKVELVNRIDAAIHESKKDGWRGNAAKENIIKGAMYKVIEDFDEVIRLFDIIKLHDEY
jgi:type I restriction enzyme R subunit